MIARASGALICSTSSPLPSLASSIRIELNSQTS